MVNLPPITTVPPTHAAAAAAAAASHNGRGGEMLFVRIDNEEDLRRSFSPKGKLNILELTDAAQEELIRTIHSDLLHLHQGGDLSVKPEVAATIASADLQHRRGYFCFEPTAEVLCGGGAAAGNFSTEQSRQQSSRPLGEFLLDCGCAVLPHGNSSNASILMSTASASPLLSSLPSPERTTVVVLTPAALYDTAGGRLGKGGGFYDLFMRRLGALRGVFHEVLFVGVGLSPQLLSGSEPALLEHSHLIANFPGCDENDVLHIQFNHRRRLRGRCGVEEEEDACDEKRSDATLQQLDHDEGKRLHDALSEHRLPMDLWDEFLDEILVASHRH
jgi:hypothetical protein